MRPPPSPKFDPVRHNPTPGRAAWAGEAATALFIALIATIARGTGLPFVLFPELGALSHDILKRPHGAWARAPVLLVVTPFLTGLVGTLLMRHLGFGLVSVLLDVGGSILIIRLLSSPIAPSISAGLLPLVLGEPSWRYPPSLLVGLGLLAGISLVWRRIVPLQPAADPVGDRADDLIEEAPDDYSWVPFFLTFIVAATLLAEVTGLRFLLFPPLVVIGFEMFAHAAICPWAGRPLLLPVACVITAAAGVALVATLGAGPLAAACSIAVGVALLRALDLHVPPALAVGLLPFVMPDPNYAFPVAVGFGTLLLTTSFLAWRKLLSRKC